MSTVTVPEPAARCALAAQLLKGASAKMKSDYNLGSADPNDFHYLNQSFCTGALRWPGASSRTQLWYPVHHAEPGEYSEYRYEGPAWPL